MVKRIRSLPPRIKHSRTSQTVRICRSPKMPTMYTFVRITQFMERNIKELPNTKGKTSGCRCIFLLLVRTGRCHKVWRDLWRCTEKYRTGRCCHCDHPRGSYYRRCFGRYTDNVDSTKHMQMHSLCTTHHHAYGIYICGKVFKWLKKMGGLEAMKKHNEEKAKILYDFLGSE